MKTNFRFSVTFLTLPFRSGLVRFINYIIDPITVDCKTGLKNKYNMVSDLYNIFILKKNKLFKKISMLVSGIYID